MSSREIVFWLFSFIVANPLLTHFMIIRKAHVTLKGKVLIHLSMALMLLFWCGVASRYFILSAISLVSFAVAVPFRESLLKNVKMN